jgi:GTP-binding protein EngB required for normal cell division
MSSCIHCGSDIDADRLEFLVDFNKPLTCKDCSMEQPAAGYKDKVKVVKTKTDAQIKKEWNKNELAKEARKELDLYNKQFRYRHNKKKKRKKRR